MSKGKHVVVLRHEMDEDEWQEMQSYRKVEAFDGEVPTVRNLLERALTEGLMDLKIRHAGVDF